MKTCTHCRMEVPTSANKCPYCLENPGDGFDAWTQIISWTIIGFVLWFVWTLIFG